jgi:hypothetical protein
MQGGEEIFRGGRVFGRIIAEDAEQLIRPFHLMGGRVHEPTAQVGHLLGFAEERLARRQGPVHPGDGLAQTFDFRFQLRNPAAEDSLFAGGDSPYSAFDGGFFLGHVETDPPAVLGLLYHVVDRKTAGLGAGFRGPDPAFYRSGPFMRLFSDQVRTGIRAPGP